MSWSFGATGFVGRLVAERLTAIDLGDPRVGLAGRSKGPADDLTVEPTFVRRSIDAHQVTAIATGARIVHSCGFDSCRPTSSCNCSPTGVIADGAGRRQRVGGI